jgi:hypothetical protein
MGSLLEDVHLEDRKGDEDNIKMYLREVGYEDLGELNWLWIVPSHGF